MVDSTHQPGTPAGMHERFVRQKGRAGGCHSLLFLVQILFPGAGSGDGELVELCIDVLVQVMPQMLPAADVLTPH